MGWVVAGVVALAFIASISDDDDATDAPSTEQSDVDVESEPSADADVAVDDSPDEAPPAEEEEPPEPTTYRVKSVTDGDTLQLANGDSVRLVGIDAPENGACGSVKATELLSSSPSASG